MRVAIFHDYFSTQGGGERVVQELGKIFHADIFTTDIQIPILKSNNFTITSLGSIYSIPCLKQTSAAMRFFRSDFSHEYDLFIFSGNWAQYAAYHNKPSIYYCQDAPVRALYDQFPVYYSHLNTMYKPFFMTWAHFMRYFDQRTVKQVHTIVANSYKVSTRVKQYYNRNSTVIYPPVETTKYLWKKNEKFWISVNRLYPEKQIELQIKIFSRIPDIELLIIGGRGTGDHSKEYGKQISNMIEDYPNIHLLGEISEEHLIDLYSRCAGLICTARDEAFGLAPIEAMASGKPVVAINSGGYLETVPSECGRLVEPHIEELISAVIDISEKSDAYHNCCIENAKKFDSAIFKDSFLQLAKKVIHNIS
ncbi:glycosyltransferase [Methanospirillum sp. J.3.6.1-F.2.7.3]|uniref:Glycosyltransferase n=2 Tax=Methanospirillum purgamenti TaxID=2834276 RepID=A0A8E7EHQ4_9EURY|nr:glycosyltransferase [Methanospirillum sp. J.3.6.1-F.2.7.3]MDX8549471.1 glycosyltransferase [Methanospirillum hungatei]QVV89247.1 glycosyltransferase [Methanospirillum sp. J.3.6.1-F.2.7.3]